MKCKDIQINLSEFIDDELKVESSLIIQNHLGECKQCSHKIESIRQLKQQLISLDTPSLNDDFEIKLQKRIHKATSRSRFSQFLPLAASVALIVISVSIAHYSTFQPHLNVKNQFITELESIGKTRLSEYENFHKWTQLVNSQESLECGNLRSKKYCSLDLEYLSDI